ncbi:peripheral-type benzodiazepine receptor-associated protein 1 isoform X10 [Gopherus flavomarginatus]|uniref:peripheral-type benzodiazepine receptor-associated protein 1 isoform X10 n=1 Tax=Gopherus flavomarginatus TaxID=286002 RepID=UPI0021CC3077|nr:peripheral-type benzodiazepine receptor-associated protein 1 isoform X10 [Gopherus flavomarginatus]
MEKQEEMKPHADLIQLSPCQGCPAWHSSIVPEALICQDSALVTDRQEGGTPSVDIGNGVVLELTPGVPEPGLEEVRNQSVLVQSQESSLWAPGQWEVPMQPLESIRLQCAMEGLRHYQTDGSSKCCADYSYLVTQNTKLLRALEELQHCCTSLKEENCLLRKSYFPETEEKVKHLKRKNAELALIAKRLEERARKLQEANLKLVNAPVAMKGSSLELCKKACAHQRAKDLTEQASALLAKDKQIEALQHECWELQAKLIAGKEGPHCLNLLDFDHLLRESQKEVLRLQRQIALKNFKECLQSSKTGSKSSSSIAANCLGPSVPTLDTSINYSSLSKGVQLGDPTLAMEAHRKVEPGVLPLGHASEEYENFPPKSVVADPESSQQTQQLEFELRKKRKKCENLEHEVRKKHKRCKELEIQLQVVQGENARLAEENTQLNGKAEWARQVESENADLKLQVVLVTKERDSALQKSQGLQTKLENLERVLKHMRDVAERRQHLEAEHKEAQLALQEKQEEVRWLQQAQAEAKREHEGAVQLLENNLDCMQAQVRDLEDQCRSHIEQFNLLSQELKRFQLQAGKTCPLTSTLVTSELPLVPCCSIPQSQCRQWEKGNCYPDVAPARPALQCTKKIHDERSKELESLPQIPDPMSSVIKIPVSGAAATSQKQVKRLESQSSSSKSESMQNSLKSCPTPEVDTASEMEELDVDSISLIPESESQGPAKLQVFLARYSYNPFNGPNENPESELPLTAGEYIYIYGDMDEDGFFEEVNDLTQSSHHERSFVGASTSSGERSDHSADEASVSPLPSRPEDQEEPVNHTAVPYPRKLTVIKQLTSGIVVGWEPPLLPVGSADIQSYNVYVDAELCQNVKSGSQMKAVIEKLDLELKTYRISVQSVTERGSSDKLRCTFCVGQDFCIAPTLLKIRSMTATTAEVTWLPCNSNYVHAVYLNEEECDTTKPGVYWYTFHSLRPSTQYVAKVEARPPRVLWELSQERREQKSAAIQFTTPLAGTPDAPLDVQAEPGPSAGILVISWLPVTIDAEGSSNGVRVTGYAVYADGQKVMEVASPTAGSVLVELSQLQMFQVCREVSVRTMSLYGESADSVPAQIPSALLKASRYSSLSQAVVSTSLPSRLICGEPKGSHPKRMPVTHCTAPLFPPQKYSTDSSDAKFTAHTTPSCDSSVNCLPGKIFPHLHLSSPRVSSVQVLGTSSLVSDTVRDEQCLTSLPQPAGVGEEPEPLRAAALKGPGEDIQAQGTEELSVSNGPELESGDVKMPLETCHTCFVEEQLKESTIDRERKADEQCLSPEPQLSTHQAGLGVDCYRDSDRTGNSVQEFLRVSPGKKLMKETSRGDSSLMVPKVKREQEEKIAEAGKRQLNLLAEHSRSSDLSDILEEEEEEEEDLCSDMQGKKQWDPRAYCSGENGGKLEPCDTDSDEEILERLLELSHQQNCSKKLFSIPEVTEEEDEEEEEEKCVHVEKRESPHCSLERDPYHAERKGTSHPISVPQAFPNTGGNDTYQNLPMQAPQEALILQKTREDSDDENPAYLELSWTQKRGSCNWSYQESRMKPTAGTSPQWGRKKGGNSQERAHDLPEVSRKKRSDVKEQCSRLLNTCSLTGGSLYRAHSLRENLNVVSSASGKSGSEICGHARPGTFRKSHRKLMPSDLADPAALTAHCFNTRSLEINIEYDSEEDQDLTFPSSPGSSEWPDGSVEGSQTGCEGWSDCSSQSESAHSDESTPLTKQEFGEEEGMKWAGSPGHHPQLPCPEKEALRSEGSSEEQGWEQEDSPAGWRRMPERPWKGIHGAALHARVWASDNEDLRLQELLGSPAWQTPTRKGNKTLRRSRILKSSISGSGTDSDNSVRIFVALFDYDPISMSPNPDAAEEELPFKEGQILKVCGDKDADGFYRGECAGRAGYIPCNMVSEVQVESEEVRKELLKQGYIPAATSVESIGNGTFAPPPRRLTVPPPKPRRAKKAELEKQENYKLHPGSSWQDRGADLITPRTMVAAFDYNPRESSPNMDVEAELTFTAGDVITVFGSMDDDGFYYGELNRQRGLVPSNFLEAVYLDGGMADGLHLENQDTCAVNAESQLNLDGPAEQKDPWPNIPEVPPSCTLICDPSPDQASLETLESSDLSTQSKKKRSFFCKGKKLLKKLGPSKKN